MKRAIIFMVSLLMLSLPLAADVPHLVNYQGILTDDSGTPLDGTYDITFAIYVDSLTMTPLWIESHTGLAIDQGLFSLLLGSSNPLWESLFTGAERWLGVTVEPDPELAPRMRMTSVPWAFRAAVADTAGSVEWNTITGMPAGFADGVDDSGGAGDGFSLDAADGSPTDAVYVDNDGNVGIGTTAPGDLLDIRIPAGSSGGLSLSHATSYNGYPTLSFNVAGSRVARIFSHQVGQHLLIQTEPGKGSIQLYPEGTFMFIATPEGVGVNNSEPSEMLDVTGNVKATAFIGDGSLLTGLPGITETDPTVPDSIKDGIDWTELTGIPADIADGDDDLWLTQEMVEAFASASGFIQYEWDPTVPDSIKDGIVWAELGGIPADLLDGDDVGESYWTESSGDLYRETGNVGIGTTSPSDILDVVMPGAAGEMHGLSISNPSTYSGYPTLSFNIGGEKIAEILSHQVGQHLLIQTAPGKGSIQMYPEGTFMFIATSEGVGVNNSEPSEMLDVTGNVKATAFVGNVMQLEPRATAPADPSEGYMYMDSTTHKLMVYDGTAWQACF